MKNNIIKQGSRKISVEEFSHIQDVLRLFPQLSRFELAKTICEHINWYTPSGTLKAKACVELLERLDDQGLVILPKKKHSYVKKKPDKPSVFTQFTSEKPIIKGPLDSFCPIKLQIANKKSQTRLWNEYIERYHPLKYRRPFGNCLRYFLSSKNEILGCLMISGAAKALRHRDQWIGWNAARQQNNLPWVINNSRYLILPWVKIKNLASHVLGNLAKCVANDWESRWGYRPVLMETFVDPKQYNGTCYRAAGWELLGMTSGRGICRPGKHYTTSPKFIFVKPLDTKFRIILRSSQLQGNISNE